MTTPMPYFTAKARAAFAKAGGDPDVTNKLAAHAQDMHERDATREGVIVGQDGTLYAITTRGESGTDRPVHAYVVRNLDPAAVDAVGQEVGLGASTIRRHAGQQVIHLTYTDLCVGAGRFATVSSPAITAVAGAAAEVQRAEQALADARGSRAEAMRAARDAGEKPGDIAAAGGIGVAMLYRLIGKQ